GARASLLRNEVAPPANLSRLDEVFMQVVDEFDPATLGRAADRDVIEHRQVLDHLAQPDAAGMRADRNAELRGEQQDRDVLIHASDPAGVDLTDADSAGSEELFEHDAVRDVLAGSDPDGCNGPGDL